MTQKFYFLIYGQNSDFLQWRGKNKNMVVTGELKCIYTLILIINFIFILINDFLLMWFLK